MIPLFTFIVGLSLSPLAFVLVSWIAKRKGYSTRTLTIYGEKFVPLEKGTASIITILDMQAKPENTTRAEYIATLQKLHTDITLRLAAMDAIDTND